MVKIGFIVEGGAEEIILKSEKFQDFANSNNLEITGVHDAKGKGNFTTYSKKVNSFVEILKDRLTQYIIIVTDLENDPFPSITTFSIAAVISHGTVFHNAAHSAISPSSKCQ